MKTLTLSRGNSVLSFIELKLGASEEKMIGYLTTLFWFKNRIKEKFSRSEILNLCDQRDQEIFKKIDARTGGGPMDRKEEMTDHEKGALNAVKDVRRMMENPTSGEKALEKIEGKKSFSISSEYDAGYRSACNKMEGLITFSSSKEEIIAIADDLKGSIFSSIDSRTSGEEDERKDAMTKMEEGELDAINDVLQAII